MADPKLVMLLLVRDEVDILRENLWFHLHQGIDFFVIMDNGSVDGSREIAAEFERMGCAYVIDEPEHNKQQGKWVTRMAHVARENFGADWLIPNDADEFWVAASGNLKNELRESDCNVIRVQRRQMVPYLEQVSDARYRFWHNCIQVTDPLPFDSSHLAIDIPMDESVLLYPCGPKILCRTEGLVSILHGNHDVEIEDKRVKESEEIVNYHYPVRTYAQFRQKVENHGSAYERNTELSFPTSWHLRRWYRILQQGDLEEEYRLQVLDRARLSRHLAAGVVDLNFTMWERVEAGVTQGLRPEANEETLAAGLELPEPVDFQISVLAGTEYPLPSASEFSPDCIVDIGANVGAASILFARRYPQARIFAFEPSSRNVALLRRNTAGFRNVFVFPFGLSDADGQAELILGFSPLTDSLYRNRNSSELTAIVPLRRASDALRELGCFPISILKLDTEGCEMAILEELRPYLPEIPYICLEYHSEADRRKIDHLLGETHLLVSSHCVRAQRGILCFMTPSLASACGQAGNEIRSGRQ
jgi:FkbM family methyltransferase